MNVAVLVPWRPVDKVRQANWHLVRRHWADAGYLVIPADDGGTPFSRGCSLNLAHDQVDADVYVIADADTITPHEQVECAVDMARTDDGIVIAFDSWRYLTEWGSQALRDGHQGWRRSVQMTLRDTVSSCVALNAATWEQVGGFDPRFRGWGFEDVAIEVAAAELAAPTRRVPGDCLHLWHPPATVRPQENPLLLDRYLAARGDPVAMRALIAEAHAVA